MKKIASKSIKFILTFSFILSMQAFAQDEKKTTPVTYRHGGGNGGDDLEIELKKRSLQIGHFLNSTVGKANFSMLNATAVIESINKTDINVTSEIVQDKFSNARTCVNEPDRNLITCNAERIASLLSSKNSEILTALLFHEILGILGLELGYQENPSLYPISSKIIPFNVLVESTIITEASIRPEFYGLDNRSYGVTLVNKSTGESLRLICLNDNIEIHRCKNFNIVRKFENIQSPIIQELAVITLDMIKKIATTEGTYTNEYTSKVVELDSKIASYTEMLFNKKQELARIGQTEKISAKNFNSVIDYLVAIIATPDQILIKQKEQLEKEKFEKSRVINLLKVNIRIKKELNSEALTSNTNYSYFGTRAIDYHVKVGEQFSKIKYTCDLNRINQSSETIPPDTKLYQIQKEPIISTLYDNRFYYYRDFPYAMSVRLNFIKDKYSLNIHCFLRSQDAETQKNITIADMNYFLNPYGVEIYAE